MILSIISFIGYFFGLVFLGNLAKNLDHLRHLEHLEELRHLEELKHLEERLNLGLDHG